MSERRFIGPPVGAPSVKVPESKPVRLDADFILAREGLRSVQRLDGQKCRYGVCNGVGIVLAESERWLPLS